MQPGGIHDPSNPRTTDMMDSGSQFRADAPAFNAYKAYTAGATGLAMAESVHVVPSTLVHPLGSNGPWNSRLSMVSVPRFRDIRSWASDQRARMKGRSAMELVPDIPDMPSGPYHKF
jgi:hypothetical protein